MGGNRVVQGERSDEIGFQEHLHAGPDEAADAAQRSHRRLQRPANGLGVTGFARHNGDDSHPLHLTGFVLQIIHCSAGSLK